MTIYTCKIKEGQSLSIYNFYFIFKHGYVDSPWLRKILFSLYFCLGKEETFLSQELSHIVAVTATGCYSKSICLLYEDHFQQPL